MEVLLDDGSLTCNVKDVLSKWEKDYSNLYNTSSDPSIITLDNNEDNSNFGLDEHISILEVKKAIDNAKKW